MRNSSLFSISVANTKIIIDEILPKLILINLVVIWIEVYEHHQEIAASDHDHSVIIEYCAVTFGASVQSDAMPGPVVAMLDFCLALIEQLNGDCLLLLFANVLNSIQKRMTSIIVDRNFQQRIVLNKRIISYFFLCDCYCSHL